MDESQEPTVTNVVKQETARQTVAFIFSVLGTVTAVYVMKKLQEPDGIRTLKMRFALGQFHFWHNTEMYCRKKSNEAWESYVEETYQ